MLCKVKYEGKSDSDIGKWEKSDYSNRWAMIKAVLHV